MYLAEQLSQYDFSIAKALAAYTGLEVTEAELFTKNMELSDYLSLVSALDADDEDTVTALVDKYIDNESEISEKFNYFESVDLDTEEKYYDFIEKASINDIAEAKIFQDMDIMECNVLKYMLPKEMKEALKIMDNMSYDKIIEAATFFNPDATYKEARDIFISTYVKENIDPKIQQEISKITRKPAATVKAPTFVDPKSNTGQTIVAADNQKKTIATQDDKGNIDIIDVRDPKVMSQIANEQIDLKRLAGLK